MFGLFRHKCKSIPMDQAKKLLAADPSIRLIDVRNPPEYRDGHIPGSLNFPVDRVSHIQKVIPDKNTKLFVYCFSGSRSRNACEILQKIGYHHVTNIGGVAFWNGPLESGDMKWSEVLPSEAVAKRFPTAHPPAPSNEKPDAPAEPLV